MPALREGDAPAKTGVEATQHFTQPPPRYSEASLVKRLEELGIGRPSTYAAIAADAEGPRICPRRQEPLRSGGERAAGDGVPRALLRALRQLRLHRRARGRAGRRLRRPARLAEIARRLLARLQAQGRRGHGPEAVARSPRRSTSSSRPGSIRRARTAVDPRVCPQCGNGRLSPARRQVRRVRRLLQLSRLPLHPEVRPGRRPGAERRPARSSATASCSRPVASGPMSSAATSARRSPRTCRSRT